MLTLDEALHDITPALLALCDVLPDDHPFHQLDPPQRRQRTLDGLKRLLLRESQEQPLVLCFEDLHWIDSETQALLDQPGRKFAKRPAAVAGQLPSRVPTQLGQQNLLHATTARPAATRKRRCLLAGAAWR